MGQADSNVKQVDELYVFARAIGEFANGFFGVAGSVRSSAEGDLSLAHQWLNEIRAHMDEAHQRMVQSRQAVESYQPCPDEYGNDTTYGEYQRLVAEYNQAAADYADAASRYGQAEMRYQEIRRLVDDMQQVAASAANSIARLGTEAKSHVNRAASIIEKEYLR